MKHDNYHVLEWQDAVYLFVYVINRAQQAHCKKRGWAICPSYKTFTGRTENTKQLARKRAYVLCDKLNEES